MARDVYRVSGMKTNYSMSDDNGQDLGNARTLYAACKAIVGKASANVIGDRGANGKLRLVAFWDGSVVRAGFGAYDWERAQIVADAGMLS